MGINMVGKKSVLVVHDTNVDTEVNFTIASNEDLVKMMEDNVNVEAIIDTATGMFLKFDEDDDCYGWVSPEIANTNQFI